MDCNVIEDLLPLYVDGCCSAESSRLIKTHLCSCPQCQKAYDAMALPKSTLQRVPAPTGLSRVSQWRASILQSLLLLFSFGVITLGVMLEAPTAPGSRDGFWYIFLIIPATAFLLSLVNWYFVRFYKSRRSFVLCSGLLYLLLGICGYAWAAWHYDLPLSIAGSTMALWVLGPALTAGCSLLFGLLSGKYSRLLGKE